MEVQRAEHQLQDLRKALDLRTENLSRATKDLSGTTPSAISIVMDARHALLVASRDLELAEVLYYHATINSNHNINSI
jgi:hypothetical protein